MVDVALLMVSNNGALVVGLETLALRTEMRVRRKGRRAGRIVDDDRALVVDDLVHKLVVAGVAAIRHYLLRLLLRHAVEVVVLGVLLLGRSSTARSHLMLSLIHI